MKGEYLRDKREMRELERERDEWKERISERKREVENERELDSFINNKHIATHGENYITKS